MVLVSLAAAVLLATIVVLWWCSRLLVSGPVTASALAAPETDDPALRQRADDALDEVCRVARLARPKLRVTESPVINGYAQLLPAQITVTTGIVRVCSDDALRALMAHELGHMFAQHGRQGYRDYNRAFGAMAVAYAGVFVLGMTLIFVRNPAVVGLVTALLALAAAHSVVWAWRYSGLSHAHEYEADRLAVRWAGVDAFDELSQTLSTREAWRAPAFLRSHPRWRQRRRAHGLS